MSSRTPSRTRKIVIRVIALVLALLICGVLYDLYFPRTTHMREFDPGEVDKALAELQAEIYRVPMDRLMEHGRLRAEAMTIRDNKAEAGGVTEEDWNRINELLRQSWRSLAAAVKS